MIKRSYEKIGGNPKIADPQDIESEYEIEYVSDIDDDPEPDVVVQGRDCIAVQRGRPCQVQPVR